MSEPLTGQELLDFVASKEGLGLSRDDIIRAAGYQRSANNGKGSLCRTEFWEAIAFAKGGTDLKAISRDPADRAKFRGSGVLKVGKNGGVFVSRAYLSRAGVKPGHSVVVSVETDEQGAYVMVAPGGSQGPATKTLTQEQCPMPVSVTPNLPPLPLQRGVPAVA